MYNETVLKACNGDFYFSVLLFFLFTTVKVWKSGRLKVPLIFLWDNGTLHLLNYRDKKFKIVSKGIKEDI